ncbi:S-layer homology domain-containing protein, partial [Sanguibacter gelidistatuariae]
VVGIGFTLGSESFGNGVINSIVANNTTYTFGLDPFADNAGSPFEAEINWMQAKGISTGTANADGTFSFLPTTTLSRQAMAAFLYRASGSPKFVAPVLSPFNDVKTSDAFYLEIAWLADSGITAGYGDGGFHPSAPVTRQALAAYLYRVAGSPAPAAPAPFTDVKADNEFADAIAWASETGITTGWEDNTFRPSQSITRQAVAAFLFRAFDV